MVAGCLAARASAENMGVAVVAAGLAAVAGCLAAEEVGRLPTVTLAAAVAGCLAAEEVVPILAVGERPVVSAE